MDAPNRIVIFNCQPIGDTIFSTPLPRLVKDAWPGVTLDMVIDSRRADIFRHNPFVDRLMPLDARSRGRGRRWVHALREARAARYDVALNLSTNEGYSILAALSGARSVRGFSAAPLAWRFHPYLRRFDPGGHLVDANVAFLRAVGIPVDGPYATEMWVDDASRERATCLWREAALPDSGPVVGIVVGAGKPEKRWPPDRIAELAAALREQGTASVLMGGPGDAPMAEAAREAMGHPPASLAGKTSLLELAALFSRLTAVVTGDTGPMHVAAAMKAPTVALFGPTNAARCGPHGTARRIVRPPSGNAVPDIPTDAVLSALADLLAERRLAGI